MNRNQHSSFSRKLRQVRGQGMTEYILVVSLVGIACISAVSVFGQKIARLYKAATISLDQGAPQGDGESLAKGLNTEFNLGAMNGFNAEKDDGAGKGGAGNGGEGAK